VTQIKDSDVYFDVSTETLNLTSIGKLKTSDKVNIERSLKMGDQLGGHFVTGHVDGVGTINKVENEPGQCTVWFSVSKELANMMIKKGSVSIDGISLTIVEIREGLFSVALIPYTLEVTTLGFKKAGEQVNIETDMLGKWVKRILTTNDSTTSGITEEMLKDKGFL
jgi:riboflavin synthase